MPVLTRLNPAQWRLLLRALAKTGDIIDVQEWMRASDAEAADVYDIEASHLIYAVLGGDRVGCEFASNGAPADPFKVRLTSTGRSVAGNLAGEHQVLAYLDHLSSSWVPVKHIDSGAARWDALIRLDEGGLIQARRLGSEQVLPLSTWRNKRQGVVVKITAKGKPYARRWDV